MLNLFLLWIDNDVCEPSLKSPRPPIAASREGRRHSLFGRAASPPCWPLYPSAPQGAPPAAELNPCRQRPLIMRPHPAGVQPCRVGFLLWIDNDVCEPSLKSPRPPIAASREGRRHSLFGRAASPPCWPLYPSAPQGAPPAAELNPCRQRPLIMRPHPAGVQPCRVGFLLWLDMQK